MDKLMPPREVAEVLGVHVKTLANWRSLGKGPLPVRVGARVMYRRSDVEAWVDEQAATSRDGMAV